MYKKEAQRLFDEVSKQTRKNCTLNVKNMSDKKTNKANTVLRNTAAVVCSVTDECHKYKPRSQARRGGEKAWFQPFAHARNHLLFEQVYTWGWVKMAFSLPHGFIADVCCLLCSGVGAVITIGCRFLINNSYYN